jgi:hypothetical protein
MNKPKNTEPEVVEEKTKGKTEEVVVEEVVVEKPVNPNWRKEGFGR